MGGEVVILRLAWPLWAILLVVVPLLVLAAWQAIVTRDEGGLWPWVRRGAMVLCLGAIALAPAVPRQNTTVETNAEVFFVVDRTGSMAAEDYDDGQPRLEGVRSDIRAISEEMAGSRFSIIAFDSQATRQLPLTSDGRAVRSWTETLVQEITFYSVGSAIDRPLAALTQALEGAAERNPGNVRIVFFLSDGENTNDAGAQESTTGYGELAHLVDGGAVLGYGTASGGQMRYYDGTSPYGPEDDADWILDTTQDGDPPAISAIDETNLRRLAQELGVEYVHRTEPGSLTSITSGIDLDHIAGDGRRDVSVYQDVYWPAAVILAGLVLWEAWYLARRFPRQRYQAAPSGALRGRSV